MFQFAAAKALALKHNAQLVLDCTSFKKAVNGLTPRNYELAVFNGNNFHYLKESDKHKWLAEELSIYYKFLQRLGLNRVCEYYRQPTFGFDSTFFNTPNNSYLIGYFQTEQYFVDYKEAIRKVFTFPEPQLEKNKLLIQQIREQNAVSVHVRRGDYVKVASNLKHHGVCSVNYYQNALSIIKEKVDQPTFYFFSDDMEWVKSNLKVEAKVLYINHNTGDQSFEDIRLMSHCKHHIIANSSFSWWGAWLNPNKEKIVIAPKPWFEESRMENKTIEIIPENWIQVKK